MTSERAEISDVRVRALADDIGENGVADTQSEAESRPVPEFDPAP